MTITLLTTTDELHENYDADEDDGRTREDQTSVPIFFSRHHEQVHRSLNIILRTIHFIRRSHNGQSLMEK